MNHGSVADFNAAGPFEICDEYKTVVKLIDAAKYVSPQ